MNRYTGPPATLGSTAAAHARLIVWCRDCRHKVEPDPAALAERYGAVCATGRYKTSEAYTAALTARRYLARRQTLPDQRGSASDRGPLP
jgi:hypothetical protein